VPDSKLNFEDCNSIKSSSNQCEHESVIDEIIQRIRKIRSENESWITSDHEYLSRNLFQNECTIWSELDLINY
jgi:hypothetical protein